MSRAASKSPPSARPGKRRGADAGPPAKAAPARKTAPTRKTAAASREPAAGDAAPLQQTEVAPTAVTARKAAAPKRKRRIADDVPAAKPVRDRFSMPAEDFDLIKLLKQRAAAAGRPTRKSELLRAGLHALRESGTVELIKSLDRLAPVRRRRDND